MPRVLGIDPGTVSIDLCGLEDGRVFLERTVPASELIHGPDSLLEVVAGAGTLDLIAGPSGYGLPLVPIRALGEEELRLAFLARDGEPGGIGGLRTLVRRLRELDLPVVFTPGVTHLPTVPAHRKANRVDLGTADKVCTAALAIHEEARRRGIDADETSLILVEAGGAFTAVLAVDRGRIVDGVGGSSGPMGYLACGALDGETAFLLERVGKELLFSGGAAWVAGEPDQPPEALAERTDPAASTARAALIEGITKAVATELAVVPDAPVIVLSGRLTRVPGLLEPLARALSPYGVVRRLEGFARIVKEAAQGAALVADGLAGGRHAALVHTLRLREASGTVLDHLYVKGALEMRQCFVAGAP